MPLSNAAAADGSPDREQSRDGLCTLKAARRAYERCHCRNPNDAREIGPRLHVLPMVHASWWRTWNAAEVSVARAPL